MPRACPVESHALSILSQDERVFPNSNVNLHGTSPWHLQIYEFSSLATIVNTTGLARGIVKKAFATVFRLIS
jgi:hypothetical protein